MGHQVLIVYRTGNKLLYNGNKHYKAIADKLLILFMVIKN
jgi:hypothetical protein